MTPIRRRSSLPLVLLALGAGAATFAPAPAAGQDDVEELGRIHGTRPPAAYYELRASRPDAFSFDRAWKGRNPRLREAPSAAPGGPPRWLVSEGGSAEAAGSGGSDGSDGGPSTMAVLGPRESAVEGTVRVPLVLGLFGDSPVDAPFTRERVHQEMFAGPNSRLGTITDYYDEVSGGRLELLGDTWGWARSDMTEDSVTAGVSGLGGRIGEYIIQLLVEVDGQGVDWGLYDNDGPDGVPNSGDDDGYVDVLAVMHPNYGAECGGAGQDDRIWSHKWSLRGATGQDYVTATPSANGGSVRVNDYTVQPVKSCDGSNIGEIGVLAHELGHGFGLPDLYDVGGRHQGIGRWGLMGSGSWGCSAYRPERPCHMSAWSKAVLGWVDVEALPADADLGTLVVEPVQGSGKVYRVDGPPGSGEFFLLENRQKTGFDSDLFEAGLLVWRIDDDLLGSTWSSNRVNTDGDRMGVHLVQPDGRNDLGDRNGNRGDPGDVFPGAHGVTEFHAGSGPVSSRTRGGEITGLTLTDIRTVGDRVESRALTRFVDVAVRPGGEGAEAASLVVDGDVVGGEGVVLRSAPFVEHALEAGAGAEVEDGVRVGFLGWDDAPDATRVRTFVTGLEDQTLVARYGGREVRLRVSLEGEEYGVAPGSVEVSAPSKREGDELWVLAEDAGSTVAVEAVPTTGFDFVAWSGALAGSPNPAELILEGPADVGASFELVYGVETATHRVEAARTQEVTLEAAHANSPVRWTVVAGELPPGLTFHATGRIVGAALEDGSFPLTLRAVDDLGLTATGTLELEVTPPVIPLSTLAAPFLLTGDDPTVVQRTYLDRNGNGSGLYDLGDFRAFLLANPGLPAGPSTTAERQLLRSVVPVFDFRRDADGGGR